MVALCGGLATVSLRRFGHGEVPLPDLAQIIEAEGLVPGGQQDRRPRRIEQSQSLGADRLEDVGSLLLVDPRGGGLRSGYYGSLTGCRGLSLPILVFRAILRFLAP